MAYVYTDKTLQAPHWEEPARATALWERAKHWEQNANYWKARCESAERRMLEHHCIEDAN